MRIVVDSTRCTGAGQCLLTAPAIFDRDEDAQVTQVTASPDDCAMGFSVQQAIVRCPSGAITLAEK